MSRFAALIVLGGACLTTLPAPTLAQQVDPSRLTVERIFGAHEFEAQGFSAQWLPDSSGYITLVPSKDPKGAGGRDLVQTDPETGKTTLLVSAGDLVPNGKSAPLSIEGFSLSHDRSKLLIFTNSRRVWRVNSRGDFWVFDRTSRELRQLGADAPAASLGYAKFSPDGLKVAYIQGNNLAVQDLREARPTLLTHSKSADEINGSFDWVYEEEFFLRDGFRWSPDSQAIAYWQINTEGVREFPLVNNAAGLYPKVTPIKYPKVGEKNAACRVGVVDIEGRQTRWLPLPGDPREHYVASMEWHSGPSGQELVIQQLNRLQNTLKLFIVASSRSATQPKPAPVPEANGSAPSDGSLQPVLVERDDAWVDLHPEIRWVDEERQFLWLSERSGWRHLYQVTRASSTMLTLTSGNFDVMDIAGVDEKLGYVYFHASPDNAAQRYLYRARLDGSTTKGERVSPKDQAGTHDDQISPDGRWSIHRFSSFDTPPVISLVRLPSHELVRVLVDNAPLKARFEAVKKRPVEFFKVEIPGASLDAWRILPPDFDPAKTKHYPLLVHVYGEPAGQTVVDSWNGGNNLWHRMLAQRGYVVVSIDNRGTPAAKGRAWRKMVYRKVGILAPEEQAAAVTQILKTSPYLDPKRVGVWGWSGGGSMTLNALFKYPDLYSMGISIAPVANQRYYDTIYQERYMGLPGENVEGFKNGSPITFASQLKGKLLLIHGTGDDNCHYQTTEALIDELIRHNKPFTMMAYPNRSHSIHEGSNTTLHLRTLMTRYLLENLPVASTSP